MTGADGAGMYIALRGPVLFHMAAGCRCDVTHAGRERREYRFEPFEHGFVAADHHAIAALQSPHAAAGPDIDVGEALGLERFGAADVVLIERITAIDNGIARLEKRREFSDGLLGDRAGRQHDPHSAGLLE